MRLTYRRLIGLLCVGYALYVFADAVMAAEPKADKADIARGRYLVLVGTCNDCHAAGFAESEGKMPESEWLTGSPIGFQGPWGISYPSNLRLVAQNLSEDQWVQRARSPMRPPMPWYTLRDMQEKDVRAMYRYIRSLGAKGEAAPAFVPPGGKAVAPYFSMEPQNLSAK